MQTRLQTKRQFDKCYIRSMDCSKEFGFIYRYYLYKTDIEQSIGQLFLCYDKSEQALWISYIGIDDDYQHQGYGSWVMEEFFKVIVPNLLLLHKFDKVCLVDCHTGNTFYQRFGFTKIDFMLMVDMVVSKIEIKNKHILIIL